MIPFTLSYTPPKDESDILLLGLSAEALISTRELRAKNIFGLSTCHITSKYGSVSEDNKKFDHLAIMPCFEAGILATIEDIEKYHLTGRRYSPVQLGNEWSGDLTMAYGRNLASIMKVDPVNTLNFYETAEILLRAMAIMENGDPARNITEGYFGQFV